MYTRRPRRARQGRRADDLVADRLGVPGQLLGRDALTALCSEQHDLVAWLDVGVDDAGELIHRDRRRHGAPDAADEHVRASRAQGADSRRHSPPARTRRAGGRARSGAGRSPPTVRAPGRAALPRGSSSAGQGADRARPDRGRTATRRRARCRSAPRRSASRAGSAQRPSWRGAAGTAGHSRARAAKTAVCTAAKDGSPSAVARWDITPASRSALLPSASSRPTASASTGAMPQRPMPVSALTCTAQDAPAARSLA